MKFYDVRSERGDFNFCGKWSSRVLPLMLWWSLAWFPNVYLNCPWPYCVSMMKFKCNLNKLTVLKWIFSTCLFFISIQVDEKGALLKNQFYCLIKYAWVRQFASDALKYHQCKKEDIFLSKRFPRIPLLFLFSSKRKNIQISCRYHLEVQTNSKKLYKKSDVFLASMGVTGLSHDIFFKIPS